jgi:tetratricopeptide (TPR) repeat protein
VFANLVLPFSDVYRVSLDGEREPIVSNLTFLRRDGKKTLLVYPPSHAAEAMRNALPDSYVRAQKHLDAGEVGPALDLLFAELRKNAKNGALADEIFSVAQGSLDAQKAKTIIKNAVAEGCDSPQILLAHANNLAAADPEAALACYRKAISADDWPSSDSLVKLGRLYQKLNRAELADCCFRRAFQNAPEPQKAAILQSLNPVDKQ